MGKVCTLIPVVKIYAQINAIYWLIVPICLSACMYLSIRRYRYAPILIVAICCLRIWHNCFLNQKSIIQQNESTLQVYTCVGGLCML